MKNKKIKIENPKGELMKSTISQLKNNGSNIIVLNLFKK